MTIVRSAALFFVVAVSTVLSQPAQNDWEVYGARQFNRRAGTPAVAGTPVVAGNSDHYTESFTVPVQSDLPCTLQIINGDEQGIGNTYFGRNGRNQRKNHLHAIGFSEQCQYNTTGRCRKRRQYL